MNTFFYPWYTVQNARTVLYTANLTTIGVLNQRFGINAPIMFKARKEILGLDIAYVIFMNLIQLEILK